MANTYQNFSNPTIIPDQPMGWQAASQGTGDAIKSMGDYMNTQIQAKQSLLLDQAKTLSGYQNMYMAYTGKRNPNIDAVLKQNPYGQAFMGQMGAASPNGASMGGIPMAAPNATGGLSMGLVPGMAPVGGGITPLVGSNGITSMGDSPNISTSTNDGSSSGPVITGGSSTFAPFGNMGPKSETSTANPAGEAAVAQAKALATANVDIPKTYATDLAGKKSASMESIARDKANLGMLQGAYDSLMSKYDAASKAGFTGNQYDAWRGKAMANGEPLGFIAPGFNKFGQFGSPGKDLGTVGGFQAIRNEVMTKMQPIMSQQFGQAGSVRIMESLLNMAQQEVGDLNNPRDVVAQKAQATLENFNRMASSGVNYAKMLGLTPNDLSQMNPDQLNSVANQIWQMSKSPSVEIPGSQFNPKSDSTTPSANINAMLQQYKAKYPGRSDQEIMAAMQKQGLV